MDPTISVIVLVWNGEAYIEACIAALQAQQYDPFEIIVVDNASTDGSVRLVKQFGPTVQLIQNSYNFGFAGGNNIGMKAANSEIIVLLNQDTAVQPGWLRAIADTFEIDPQIGVVGCKALYPDSQTIQHAGAWVRSGDAFAYHFGQGEEDQGQHETLKDVEYVTAAAFAVSRQVIETVGYLDEQLHPGFYEDPDYCLRAQRAGFRVVYQPKAVLFHHETTSLPSQSYGRVAAFHRNRVRFVLKHWTIDALKEFVRAEEEAIAATLGLDDAIARGHGYWHSLTALPAIVRQRAEDRMLGDALSQGEIRWLFDALQTLRQQAYDRVADLLHWAEPANVEEIDLPPVASVGAEHSFPDMPSPLRSALWDEFQTHLQRTAQHHQLEEYVFRSQIPVLGKWIAKFRSVWNSVSTRWYVLPMMRQQTLFNLQVCQTLEAMNNLMAEIMEMVEQQDASTLARQRQQEIRQQEVQRQQMEALQGRINAHLAQIRQQMADLPHQIDERQRVQRQLLAEDDASLVEALRALTLNAQGPEKGEDQSG